MIFLFHYNDATVREGNMKLHEAIEEMGKSRSDYERAAVKVFSALRGIKGMRQELDYWDEKEQIDLLLEISATIKKETHFV